MDKIELNKNNALPESLSGIIENITFHNEDNGFTILKVKVKGQYEPVTVVCSLATVNIGEWLTAQGSWQRDKYYGLQFRSEQTTTTPPTTLNGIEKYLGSGLIKGIGPVYAKKLVEKFGEQVIDVIENQSARLEEVDGIGTKRRRLIKAAWEAQKSVRDIMLFLHSHGVGTSRAVRIYKTYGDHAIELIRENPYRLAIDIPGIGFKIADQIARKIGIAPDSILRACACLNHILLEATSDGHCALPESVLLQKATELLQVNEAIIQYALKKSIADEKLAREIINDNAFIYLPNLIRAENIVATKIAQLLKGKPLYPSIVFEKAIDWYQKKYGKTLAEEQKEAVKKALDHRLLIITGGPGVGKTTIVHALISILNAKKLKCLLCAPTGRAAKRLSEVTKFEAKTIHRLLETNPQTGSFLHNEKSPLECDLLIVDETSMVDILLMSHLLRAVPPNGSVIFVGDVDQLPSVGPGTVLRDLIDSNRIPVARLTKIFRQSANSQIVIGAHQINEGLTPQFGKKNEQSDFFFIKRDKPDDILKTLIEIVSKRIPQSFGYDPMRDIQVLAPMHKGIIGIQELNKNLQEILNPLDPDDQAIEKFGWQFRLNDKVMQIENDYQKDVFNGDIGKIIKIDLVEKELVVKYEQKEVIYEFDELDEIVPAYAISIHKAQGCEFPVVVIPLAMQQFVLLQRNLIYTAVTRGKKLVVIIGEPRALTYAIKNNNISKRFSGLLNRMTERIKAETELI